MRYFSTDFCENKAVCTTEAGKSTESWKIGLINCQGCRSEDKLLELKIIKSSNNIDVLCITESHLDNTIMDWVRDVLGPDLDFVYRNRDRMRSSVRRNGGVLCIFQKGLCEQAKISVCDDLIWVRLGEAENAHFIAVPYFVDATSTHHFKNEERMIELQNDIERFKQDGKVMVLTDANAWIGNWPSTIFDDIV